MVQNKRHSDFLKSKAFYFLSLILFICFTFSCQKDEPSNFNSGKNYFPDHVGRYVVYEADSTVYDDFNDTVIQYKYLLKEKIESIFTDNEGRPTLRIERYLKWYNDSVSYDSMSWQLKDVWSANITSRTAEVVEENTRFIKLIFPVREGEEWNGNSQNTLGTQEYEYTTVDEPLILNGLSFDSTLTVLQENVNNLIQQKSYKEKYARNVGMIYREYVDVADTSALPPFNIVRGVKYFLNVKSFGTE